MKDRRGERIGWTAGWLGGFVWVFALSCVFLVQGRTVQGAAGMALGGIAVLSVALFTPWRFPSTPYWKLMLAPYGAFLLSTAWAIWAYGGLEASGLTWWNLLWLLPLLLPLGTLSSRRWDEGARRDAPPDGDTRRR